MTRQFSKKLGEFAGLGGDAALRASIDGTWPSTPSCSAGAGTRRSLVTR